MATKRKAAKRSSSSSVSRAKKDSSLIIQFAVVFIFVAAIALVAYVAKNFM